MSERVERLRRVLAVQQQMQRIEEWKLAEIERRIAALDAAQREVIAALNQDSALHGLFVDATAKRLNALAKDARRAEAEKAQQVPRLTEQTARLRLAERLFATAEVDAQRQLDRTTLLDLIEGILSEEPQASRKFAKA
jgi:hypothetical protein